MNACSTSVIGSTCPNCGTLVTCVGALTDDVVVGLCPVDGTQVVLSNLAANRGARMVPVASATSPAVDTTETPAEAAADPAYVPESEVQEESS